MHAVVRTYSGKGAIELFDILEQRKPDVENVIGQVGGFRSYYLIRTADGGISVTVCDDKAGTDESVQVAATWIRENAPGTVAKPTNVSEGPVILDL